MNRSILVLLLLCLSAASLCAQTETAEAYLITTGGDTLHRTVLLPRDFNWNLMHPSFNRELRVLESDSTARIFKPGELIGFGVRKRRLEAHYRRLPVPGTNRVSFFQVALFGSPLMLYYAGIPANVYAAGAPYGYSQYRNIDKTGYVLDSGGRMLLLNETAVRPLRRKLRGFFKTDPAALDLIDRFVRSQSDIPEFIGELNRLNR